MAYIVGRVLEESIVAQGGFRLNFAVTIKAVVMV